METGSVSDAPPETSSRPELGVVFPAQAPVEDLPAFAAAVEAAGLEQLWLIEDCFLAGGLTMAATALALTERLRVGVGLLPAPIRNPALAAMEIATLARLHPGRLEIAFGHGVREWMDQIGALPQRRLAALEEVVLAVRRLLAGETVTVTGSHVRLDRVALEPPPAVPPPILVGTTGPKGVRLAARSADGLLMPEGCGPAFVEWAAAELRDERPQAELRKVVYAWLRIDDDPSAAEAALRPALEGWLASGLYPEPLKRAGVPLPPQSEDDFETLTRELAVAGEPSQCAAAIERLAAAGADSVVLVPVGSDPAGQVERLAGEVLLSSPARGALR
jgi:alkanesulfonate monooxygenase SsuD/methylene tetrahydromethanopterin reductase-like flavin-dependent oxidoreductase (luciferase family)